MMGKFKIFLFFSFSLLLVSCYDDDVIIIDENNERLLHAESELTILMKSVVAHDTTKDFVVTHSNCFTINLPYEIKVDGELRQINHYDDLEDITLEHSIIYVFPLEISFVNYESIVVNNQTELNLLNEKCDNEGLNYHKNTCAEFIYPIEIATYNTLSQRFDTVTLEHDYDGFVFIDNLSPNDLFSINYPTEIIISGNNHFSIEDNSNLALHFRTSSATCQ